MSIGGEIMEEYYEPVVKGLKRRIIGLQLSHALQLDQLRQQLRAAQEREAKLITQREERFEQHMELKRWLMKENQRLFERLVVAELAFHEAIRPVHNSIIVHGVDMGSGPSVTVVRNALGEDITFKERT